MTGIAWSRFGFGKVLGEHTWRSNRYECVKSVKFQLPFGNAFMNASALQSSITALVYTYVIGYDSFELDIEVERPVSWIR